MILEEGLSTIELPDFTMDKGPGTKRAGFYNPQQVLNRDITILLLKELKPARYLDGFGGSGIRGIRVSLETDAEAVISEINSKSAEIILENVRRNNVSTEVVNEPFESVVSRNLFDFIDIDPYGSIVPFLDVALTHVKNNGYLGLTATDLSALTGSAPSKTRRRYNAFIKTDMLKHESGLRLLIAYVAQRAAAMDIAVTPIISFWKSHYYRAVVKVKHGSGVADRTLQNIGEISKDQSVSSIYERLPEGPIWKGKLQDLKILNTLKRNRVESIDPATYNFIESIRNEDSQFYFYEMTDFARKLGRSLPPISKTMDEIESEYNTPAYRTHFSPTGIKAAITGEEFYRTFERISHA